MSRYKCGCGCGNELRISTVGDGVAIVALNGQAMEIANSDVPALIADLLTASRRVDS